MDTPLLWLCQADSERGEQRCTLPALRELTVERVQNCLTSSLPTAPKGWVVIIIIINNNKTVNTYTADGVPGAALNLTLLTRSSQLPYKTEAVAM